MWAQKKQMAVCGAYWYIKRMLATRLFGITSTWGSSQLFSPCPYPKCLHFTVFPLCPHSSSSSLANTPNSHHSAGHVQSLLQTLPNASGCSLPPIYTKTSPLVIPQSCHVYRTGLVVSHPAGFAPEEFQGSEKGGLWLLDSEPQHLE